MILPTTYWKPHPLGWGAINSLVDITGEYKMSLNTSGAGLNASSTKRKLTSELVELIVISGFDQRTDGTRKSLKIRL
jgi:hypothetical protein